MSGEKTSTKISPKAYCKILLHALRFCNEGIPKEDWKEVVGLLLGYHDKTKLETIVVDVEPVTHGEVVQVNMGQYEATVFSEICLRPNAEEIYVVGWYHSHPGHGNEFMSETDLDTHSKYQMGDPNSIAIIIDPTLARGANYGIRNFRVDKPHRFSKSQALEIPLSINPSMEDVVSVDFLRGLAERNSQQDPIILEYPEVKNGVSEVPKFALEFQKAIEPLSDSFSQIAKGFYRLSRDAYAPISELASEIGGTRQLLTKRQASLRNALDKHDRSLLELCEFLNRRIENIKKSLSDKLAASDDEMKKSFENVTRELEENQSNLKELVARIDELDEKISVDQRASK